MPDFPALPISDLGVANFKTALTATPSTWPANTKISLCNVDWDNEYRDVVYWANYQAREDYFATLLAGSDTINLENATYCKVSEPIRIPVPYSTAYTKNYVVVENPKLPTDDVKIPKYYYFIVGVEYIAPNTTGLYLQLDVWTTFGHRLHLGRCYVERGHAAIHAYANSLRLGSYSYIEGAQRRYLMAPEGLDLGSAYLETNEAAYSLMRAADSSYTDREWVIIIVSAVELAIPSGQTISDYYGTVSNPKLHTAHGMGVDGYISGCMVYGMLVDQFLQFMSAISDYPWISNQILSVSAMPHRFVHFSDTAVSIAGVTAYRISSQARSFTTGATYAVNWTESNITSFQTAHVSGVWARHPKGRVWPYSYLKLSNYVSQPLTLCPEQLNNDEIVFIGLANVMPPFQRIFVFPKGYGATTYSTITGETQYTPGGTTWEQTIPFGEKFESALVWADFPQYSIVNDSYIAYLASNAHSLQFARDNAGWQQEKSLANSNTSYDNANRSLGAASENQQLAYETQRDIARFSMGNQVAASLRDTFNSLSSGAQGAASDFFGADVGAIINTTVNAATGQTANELGNMQFQNTLRAQKGNIDANYKLQQWAARGDYAQAIASINASTRDARMLSPTQSGVLGGAMMAILGSRALSYFYLSAFTVNSDYQHKIADYWDRYGYSIGEFMYIGRNFLLNKHFTYWKMLEVTITRDTTDLDEATRNILRGIFEKGVTIWADPAEISAISVPVGNPTVSLFEDNTPNQSNPLY